MLQVPEEPRLLGFDPAASPLAKLFEDEIARSIWLLVSYQHLVDYRETPMWCRQLADRIREKSPQTPRDLFELIRTTNMLIFSNSQYILGPYQDVEALVTRMLEAVTGRKPIEYKLLLPGTPEREAYDLARARASA